MNTLLTTVIGIYIGDLRHAVCVLDEDGSIAEEYTITNTRESLTKFAKKYLGALVAMEVGSHIPWISRLLNENGCNSVVNRVKVRTEPLTRKG